MKIVPYNPGQYLVESRSRPGEHHIVDVIEKTCSCESKEFEGVQCDHLAAVIRHHEGITPPEPASPFAMARCKTEH